jgi:hypothetical protein
MSGPIASIASSTACIIVASIASSSTARFASSLQHREQLYAQWLHSQSAVGVADQACAAACRLTKFLAGAASSIATVNHHYTKF